MKNGMVKAEDVPHFASAVYDEAHRLIRMVDDIIRLSRLDEALSVGASPNESGPVDLLELSRFVLPVWKMRRASGTSVFMPPVRLPRFWACVP